MKANRTTKPDTNRAANAGPRPRRAASLGFLMATTLMTGAGVIMLEVLGARIAGPIFGVSLYIWTALITVTLVALSLGYWLGGMAADRWPVADVMYGLIAAAGLMISVIPLIDGAVLVGCYEAFGGDWGVRLGVLCGAFILFGPPLTILGMVSPYVLRLALADLRETGRTAGTLYAISTVGSVIGTIAAGFFLIPELGVKATFWASTAVILLPPAVWFAIGRQMGWLGMGALVLATFGFLDAATARPINPMFGRMQLSREGQYAQIKVLDRSYQGQMHRMLLLDGTVQTSIVLGSKELQSGYTQVIERFFAIHPPKGRRALLVGLGGGALVEPLKMRGFKIDVVELDPAIVETARDYFGCDPAGFRLIEADGRAYIRACRDKYDAIVLDVFTGGSQPFHLFSREAFEEIKRILAPGGVVALNTIAFTQGPDSLMSASLFRTAAGVFEESRGYFGELGEDPNDLRNVLMFFSNAPFSGVAVDAAAEAWRPELEKRRFHFAAGSGIVVTDDLNPVDRWCARVNEYWREGIMADIGGEVLSW
ncbi:fused MFS/spermidine synthase [bacterium]|nr:fused MFS/spermidine synthase [bacterium]